MPASMDRMFYSAKTYFKIFLIIYNKNILSIVYLVVENTILKIFI